MIDYTSFYPLGVEDNRWTPVRIVISFKNRDKLVEMVDWCVNNGSTQRFSFERPASKFLFESEEDAMLFALKWVHG